MNPMLEIGITTWPAHHPEKANYLKPGLFFAVTTDSKNVEEAVKLINYITNDISCNNILLGERGIPISSVVAEEMADNMEKMDQQAINYINKVITPKSSMINPPAPDKADEVIDKLGEIVDKVCYKQLSAEQAASQFYEAANKILANE